ncbi:MAG: glutathione peroxidase [Deltaproteobacteria bacterium]|nr:glutathione peroxidase [Deltaproteobacteria bacterium]
MLRNARFRLRHGAALLAVFSLIGATSSCGWREVHVKSDTTAAASGPIIDHQVKDLHGATVALSQYRGKAMLIVNTASQCGFTPQYKGLQALHERYASKGLAVLGFPCNDFGGQEPGTPEQIETFCATKYSVAFPLFEKVRAKGDKSPLYKTLTEDLDPALRGEIKWNFTKFLVAPDGRVVARFEPGVDPLDPAVIAQIEANLPR